VSGVKSALHRLATVEREVRRKGLAMPPLERRLFDPAFATSEELRRMEEILASVTPDGHNTTAAHLRALSDEARVELEAILAAIEERAERGELPPNTIKVGRSSVRFSFDPTVREEPPRDWRERCRERVQASYAEQRVALAVDLLPRLE
jgi:hypothetical protein